MDDESCELNPGFLTMSNSKFHRFIYFELNRIWILLSLNNKINLWTIILLLNTKIESGLSLLDQWMTYKGVKMWRYLIKHYYIFILVYLFCLIHSNIEKRAKMLNILENKSIYLSIYITLRQFYNPRQNLFNGQATSRFIQNLHLHFPLPFLFISSLMFMTPWSI